MTEEASLRRQRGNLSISEAQLLFGFEAEVEAGDIGGVVLGGGAAGLTPSLSLSSPLLRLRYDIPRMAYSGKMRTCLTAPSARSSI